MNSTPDEPPPEINILVVEDNEEQAKALCGVITRRIPLAVCRLAHNLEDGLRLANELRADLTLLDLHIPLSSKNRQMDLDVTVQSILKFPEPVIVVTQMADPNGALMEYCFAYGAENFFSKDHLLKIVETWDGEMQRRVLISSMSSAFMRRNAPSRRHLYKDGIAGML